MGRPKGCQSVSPALKTEIKAFATKDPETFQKERHSLKGHSRSITERNLQLIATKNGIDEYSTSTTKTRGRAAPSGGCYEKNSCVPSSGRHQALCKGSYDAGSFDRGICQRKSQSFPG